MLRVSSPPSFALSSNSTSRFSPTANLAGFLPPPPPPLLPLLGIGGSPLLLVTFASELAFLLLRRRRLLRPLLLVVPVLSELNTEAVSEMRRPDMSMLSWLPEPAPAPVPVPVPVGTGPPGPPRRRRGCDVVLAGEEEVGFGREAVSGEDIGTGDSVGR